MINLAKVVALIREEGHTQVYRKDHSTCTVQLTPKTMARRDALLEELLREGAPQGDTEFLGATKGTDS